ncbi:protein SAWADEE HOMEODOMAIN HOMOLOG 2-like [Triticum aestivum]|uniref:protein SAWADEE HOMEODOMAIN HOMOLOG 2-like n=1 Tax=Triticum aestivum TaxID=4565 RepID=UPI001D012895|nr:protein SAWADEE HOMEODOMAIN HOMOLOG 2-like [Triticum aestivum]
MVTILDLAVAVPREEKVEGRSRYRVPNCHHHFSAGRASESCARGKMLPTGAEAQHPASYWVQSSSPSNSESQSGNTSSDGGLVQLEAKSPRNGAWFDVAAILSSRFSETGDQEIQVWFSGFGAEEEEWINVCKSVRLRSLPCIATECVGVLPGDLILCYQERKEQALYFDAHVLQVDRRTRDLRGCCCSFLVRYDHDHSEEIVSLRKVCRRPSADVKIDIVFDHSLAEQKAQKSHKRMDVNPDEVPVVPSPPNQGGPSDKLAAPLLISPDSTHRDSVADVQMGDIEAAPNGESTSKAHGDKMNVGA